MASSRVISQSVTSKEECNAIIEEGHGIIVDEAESTLDDLVQKLVITRAPQWLSLLARDLLDPRTVLSLGFPDVSATATFRLLSQKHTLSAKAGHNQRAELYKQLDP
jgi:hypothetical protein